MGEDRVHQFFLGGFQVYRPHIALDHFRDLGYYHVGAQKLAGCLVEDHLDEPLVLDERNRLAVANERKTADPDIELFLFRGGFGEADRRDLRRAIRAAGNLQLVHGMRLEALDGFDADDAFMLRFVCEQGWTRNVANGVDAGNIGAAISVDHDRAAVDLDAKPFETKTFHTSNEADRGNDAIDGERLRAAFAIVDGGGDAVRLSVEPRYLGAGENLDALFFERLAGKARYFGVLDGQDLRQHFDHRHLRPERAIERGELDADGAGTDHQQRLRHALGDHGLEIGPHQFLVRLKARQHPRPRPGGDDDVLCLIRARRQRAFRSIGIFCSFGFGGLDGHLAGRVDRRLAPDHRYFVLLHQEADAVIEALRHAARTFDHCGRVVGNLFGCEPIVLGMLHIV